MTAKTKKYTVRVIETGEFGDTLFASDDAAAAKAKANELGSDHYYGVAIIESETGMVDLGDRVVPMAEAFR